MLYPLYNDTSPETAGDYLVSGLFREKSDARGALAALEKNGFRDEEVSVALTGDTKAKMGLGIRETASSPAFAAWGGLAAGSGGALMCGWIALTAPVTEALGIAAAGPVLATLAGFGAGALAGGLLGALIGLGIPRDEIEIGAGDEKMGHMLLAVKTRGLAEATVVDNIFKNQNAMNTHKTWQAFAEEDRPAEDAL